jgi:hypothetical protein
MVNRKGSLNLSIQAIVIVVIAFVVLGLGLGFVKNTFGDIEGSSAQVVGQITDQLNDQIAKSNEPLYFPSQKLVLEAGEEKVHGVGVKNTGDLPLDLKVKFYIREGQDFRPFNSGEVMSFGTGDNSFEAGVFWDDTSQKFSAGEGRPFPITITAPSKFGNYLYRVEVMKVVDDVEESYASKTFFIRTS